MKYVPLQTKLQQTKNKGADQAVQVLRGICAIVIAYNKPLLWYSTGHVLHALQLCCLLSESRSTSEKKFILACL